MSQSRKPPVTVRQSYVSHKMIDIIWKQISIFFSTTPANLQLPNTKALMFYFVSYRSTVSLFQSYYANKLLLLMAL